MRRSEQPIWNQRQVHTRTNKNRPFDAERLCGGKVLMGTEAFFGNKELAISPPIQPEGVPHVRIQASTKIRFLDLRELWAYRDLLYILTWRDITVRYKQTVLGASWAILQPLLTMMVFSLFFGRLAKVPSDGVPYPIFSYVALVPWTFFAGTLALASNSIVHQSNVLTKVYFPRLAIPISTIIAGLVDFALSFTVLLGMLAYFRIPLTVNVLFLPVFLLLALVTLLGTSLWLAALNVQYRDVRFTIPFLTQFWMFATPVAYPSSMLPGGWRLVFGLNPMVGVVEGFRWSLLGVNTGPGPIVLVSSVVAVVLLITGTLYFRRMERTFADIV
jgi:lipopolysaccharide transport system permease protein